MSRPMANEYSHTVFKRVAGAKEPVPVRVETRRGATTCSTHSVRTEDFCGVNEHGWIFRCPGDRQIRDKTERDRSAHSFVAEPPKEAAE